jgi:hypothetical protein
VMYQRLWRSPGWQRCPFVILHHMISWPSFSSFGWEDSEEKIKMWKVNGRRTPSDGKSSRCLWQGELKICSLQTARTPNLKWNILESMKF